jgi:hypothetical protein
MGRSDAEPTEMLDPGVARGHPSRPVVPSGRPDRCGQITGFTITDTRYHSDRYPMRGAANRTGCIDAWRVFTGHAAIYLLFTVKHPVKSYIFTFLVSHRTLSS